MSFTPGTGTYLTIFSTTVSSSTPPAAVDISLFSNNAQITHTERTVILNVSPQDIPMATNAIITVTGGQAIDVRWKTSAGTATMYERTLNLVKIA